MLYSRVCRKKACRLGACAEGKKTTGPRDKRQFLLVRLKKGFTNCHGKGSFRKKDWKTGRKHKSRPHKKKMERWTKERVREVRVAGAEKKYFYRDYSEDATFMKRQ